MAHLQTSVLTHQRKVCSLYKRALRNVEAWHDYRFVIRKECAFMRHRFEQNKNIKDLIIANKLLKEGEEELFQKLHPQPKKFKNSPGGILYERYQTAPDWVLDYWQPIEKAAFPEYFAKRELRKKEYIKLWEKNFGRDP